MKARLAAVFLVIVLAPLALLAYLGVRLNRDEQAASRQRVGELVLTGLRDTRRVIDRVLERRQRELLKLTEQTGANTTTLRETVRKSAIVRQLFVLGADCGRVHPPLGVALNRSEREFASRAGPIWPDLLALCRGGKDKAKKKQPGVEEPATGAPSGADHGWYLWQWGGSGTDVIFWRRPPAGGLVGAELDTIKLLSDIVGELPHTAHAEAGEPQGHTALVDGTGRVLYQWGEHQPAAGATPDAELALTHPLSAWTLRRTLPASAVEALALGGNVWFGLTTSLVLAGLLLVGLALYFFRHQSSLMREASQRVSFVNRVSHELRTPLTNIRLYAELLEGRLAGSDDKSQQQLGVIVSESQRLSRLIGNVLAFSRHQQGRLSVHPARRCVDDVVRMVLEHFSASLADRGIEVQFEAGAGAEVMVDGDALEQILGNLVSNVEKYAAAGGELRVQTHQDGEKTTVRVADRGPGIPRAQVDRVFEPFFRLSDALTESGSGTGLGLGIARDLARLHGGDLRVVPGERGVCFELVLHTPPIEQGGAG